MHEPQLPLFGLFLRMAPLGDHYRYVYFEGNLCFFLFLDVQVAQLMLKDTLKLSSWFCPFLYSIPVTEASVERSFGRQKFVKTPLRNPLPIGAYLSSFSGYLKNVDKSFHL